MRLAYLLAQHPLHLHRQLVRRGLALAWLDAFRPFWDRVRPPGLPITDYASFTWLEYHFAARLREKYPTGDHFDDPDAQFARLLSYVKRRELHPLRMLKVAWHLRHCRTVLEFGAGAAPYAHFIATAWPLAQQVAVTDRPSLLPDYARDVGAFSVGIETALLEPWDGIVCTEVFEHLPDPLPIAAQMRKAAPVVCFDYVNDGHPARQWVLDDFAHTGQLTGPDKRGLYVWRAA